MILARALAGFAFGFLLATSAVFATAGWRSGLGCLACAVVGGVLAWDLDRVTRQSRWQERDAERAAQALREASNRDYGFRVDSGYRGTWYSFVVDDGS